MATVGDKMSWAAGSKTVLCVGSNVIDYVIISKSYPKENSRNICSDGFWQRGGNASNISTVLRNLGAKVEFFGMLSTAELFQIIEADMKNRGIVTKNCPRTELDPPFSTVILNKSTKTRNIINCNNNYPHPTLEDFRKLDLNKYGWIHFQCRELAMTLSMVKDVVAFNKKHEDMENIIISIGLLGAYEDKWPVAFLCDYCFIAQDTPVFRHWNTSNKACSVIQDWLSSRMGIDLKRPHFIFQWEEKGAALLDLEGQYSFFRARKVQRMVDSLGVMETFVGAFIYAVYIRNREPRVAMNFGNAMACYKCSNYGFDHITDILVPPVL